MKFKNIFKRKNINQDFIATPKQKPALGVFKVSTILRAMFFFLLVTVPLGLFAYVIYHSTGLSIYQNYLSSDGYHIWHYMSVPNAYNIFALFWAGMGCLIFTAIMICLFGVVNRYVANKKIKTAYVFTIIILAAVGVLLAALSQYFYAKFFDFYLYEAKTGTDSAVNNMTDWASPLSGKLTADYNDGKSKGIFDWMQSSVVWWVMFVQFMFLFGVGVGLQNALNSNDNLNDYEKYIADTKRDEAGLDLSRLNKFFKNMFSNSDKSIAKFLIIAAVVIVIPNFVYSILGTIETTHMQSVVAWSFKVPTLIKDINYTGDSGKIVTDMMATLSEKRYGSVFVVSSLPIIFEGLTIATMFFFIAMLLRGKNVSNRIFVVESIVLAAEVIALVAVSFVSKVYVHRLTDFWQTANGNSTNLGVFTDNLKKVIGDADYKSLAGMYPLNGIENDKSIHIEWLNMSATIAEVVIAYAWVFGTFTLIGDGIYRLGYFKKENLVTYKNGIWNN